MYVHGIRKLFRFPGHVVAKISMTDDLAQVNLRRDRRCRLACPACGATMGRNRVKHIARLAEANGSETPPDEPLFDMDWRNLLRTFNLDLAAAGIPKCDAQGRTLDVHSLRHTFATLLARNGVSPGVAQKLMGHSPSASLRALSLSKGDIRLTSCAAKRWRRRMNTYTHLDLADTAGAVEALPRI